MRTFSLLLAFALAGLCPGAEKAPASTSQDKEPTYNGKTLAQWIDNAAEGQYSVSRREAAASLEKFGPAAVPALVKLLKDKDIGVREAAARGLGHIGPEANSAVPALVELLKHKNTWLRRDAIDALEKIGPGAVPVFVELFRGPQRFGAANSLAKIGPAAVPALTDLLKDKDGNLRALAAKTLGRIGPGAKTAVPALTQLLTDKENWVRWNASKALEKIGPAATPVLRDSLKDKDAASRRAIAETLWETGPKDETSIPALLELLKGQDGQARRPAGETVRMVAFLADREGKQGCDFPAWIDYRKAVGDSPASRQLFGDMLAAEPELCAGIGGDPKRLAELLAQRLGALDDSDKIRRGRYKAGLGDLAAVFFVAARPDVAPFFNDDPGLFRAVDRILRYGSSPKCLRMDWSHPDPEGSIVKQLVNRWVMQEGQPTSITIRLELADRFGLKNVMDSLALRLVRHSQGQQISGSNETERWADFAVQTARRAGKKEDCRFLANYLERANTLDYRFRPQLRWPGVDPQLLHIVEPQLRDLALGVIVDLNGEKPEEYGFLEYQPTHGAPVYLFQTAEQRNHGFALCIKNYRKLGLENPPKYTPEVPPRFYYVIGPYNHPFQHGIWGWRVTS
jgi:hypothetical protein